MEPNRAAQEQWIAFYKTQIASRRLPILIATAVEAILLTSTAIPILMVGNAIGSQGRGGNARQTAVIAAAVLTVLAMGKAAAFFFANTNKIRLAISTNQLFQQNILAHIFRLPADVKEEKHPSEYISALTSDSSRAAEGMVEAPILLTRALATLGWSAVLLFFIDFKMLVIMAVILPVTYTTLRSIRSIASARERDLAALKADVRKRLSLSIDMSSYIQIWNREQHEIQEIKDVQKRLSDETEISATEISLYRSVTDLLRTVMAAVALAAAPLLATNSGTLYGDAFAAAVILLFCVRPLEDIQAAIREDAATKAAANRIFSILHDLPEIAQSPDAVKPLSINGKLTFENFGLNLNNHQLLQGLSFTIDPGHSLAISGKDMRPLSAALTCIPLLMYYTEGRILIDDTDNRDLALPILHRAVSYVGYKARFLPISVADNVAVQSDNPDPASLAAALGKAHIYDAISQAPGGLDAIMDEHYLESLSQFDKLKLTLARAFMAEAPIVLLEEPFKELNDDDKQLLLPIVRDLMQNRTVLLLTRDRELLTMVEQVMVLHEHNLHDVAEYGGLDAFKDSLGHAS